MAVLSIYVTFGVFRAGIGVFVPSYQSSFPLLHGGCQLPHQARAASGSSGTFHLTQQLLSSKPNPCQLTGSDEGKKQHGEKLSSAGFWGGEDV